MNGAVGSYAHGRGTGRSPVHVCGLVCVSSLGRHQTVVRAVWRVFRVVSGIQTDIDSNVQSPVDRRGLSEIERIAVLSVKDRTTMRSITLAPHYRRAEHLLRIRSVGVVRLTRR